MCYVRFSGGFLPKGPSGLIDEYYAVFPSTPSGPPVPHLTTSMQLDIAKGNSLIFHFGKLDRLPTGKLFSLPQEIR